MQLDTAIFHDKRDSQKREIISLTGDVLIQTIASIYIYTKSEEYRWKTVAFQLLFKY